MGRKSNSNLIRIGITGSPGTGKKSIGRELARLLNLKFISLNDEAIRRKAGRWERHDGGKEFLINIPKLRKSIETKNSVLVGHLLSEIVPSKDLDFVAVLRCSPTTLRRRYQNRGYSPNKIRENLEAELLDLISVSAIRTYGQYRVSEFDTTRTKNPKTVALRILKTFEGKSKKRLGVAEWSSKAGASHRNLLQYVGAY